MTMVCACVVQVQIAILMQLQGSRADPAQLERLQSMLSEKNGEIQNLMTKLQRLEKVEVSMSTMGAPLLVEVCVLILCVLCVCGCTDDVEVSARKSCSSRKW